MEITYRKQKSFLIILFDLTDEQATRALKDINEYKDKAIAMVAHDLRTPLNGIIGILNLISDKITENPEIYKYLNACSSLAEVQLNIVNTYLDASQIQNKKLKLVPVGFKLRSFLEELKILYDLLCKQKRLKFDILYLGRLPKMVYTDANRLRQILMNLLSNALKFTFQGSITLKVESEGSDMNILKFTVADTGVGMKKEDKEKLFKAFGRLESNSYVNPYGVGLGLVISNNLVSLLNPDTPDSHIDVDGEENIGAKFMFSIARKLFFNSENKGDHHHHHK